MEGASKRERRVLLLVSLPDCVAEACMPQCAVPLFVNELIITVQ
jgi:hypothetical protein